MDKLDELMDRFADYEAKKVQEVDEVDATIKEVEQGINFCKEEFKGTHLSWKGKRLILNSNNTNLLEQTMETRLSIGVDGIIEFVEEYARHLGIIE